MDSNSNRGSTGQLSSTGSAGGGMHHSQSTPAGVDGGARTPPATPKKGGKMLAIRVQMLDDNVTIFQVQEHFCKSDFDIGFLYGGKDLRLKKAATPHLLLNQNENQEMECSCGFDPIKHEPVDVTQSMKECSLPENQASSSFNPQPEFIPMDEDNIASPSSYKSCSQKQKASATIKLEKQLAKFKNQVLLLKKENARLKKENTCLKSKLPSLLNEDQKSCLKRKSFKGLKWSDETMMKAYKLRLVCGSTGYDIAREMCAPLPSQRTLQRRMEHLKFSPGILDEVLVAMETKVQSMIEEERHCALLLDEMAINPTLDFDPSIGTCLGRPTVPSANLQFEDVASHDLVYMLAGITSRWKQVVAYEFTGRSFDSHKVKDDIETIISKAERLGLIVDVVISDMGGQNRAIWKLYNIHAGRHEKIKNYAPHPCDNTRKLYFHPNPPHIFKNLRDHLTNGQQIKIPSDFVEKYSLPSEIVDLKYIQALVDIDSADLKLAPYLKESCLKPSHYEKMKVGLALRLLNHDTGAAIRYCVERGLLPKESISTAWFCETMHKWFKLVTSRTKNLAMSFDDPQNLIELSEFLLTEKNFNYICLGRFTQDGLENLFSMIRFINPVPSPKYFKMALRLISVAQFFKPIKRGTLFDFSFVS